jgi:hypothetical protein
MADHYQSKNQKDGTILFRAGSEFLICKREEIDGITHVYMREV